jgi:4-hydroxy-2-oxoheptanedioate aldolase
MLPPPPIESSCRRLRRRLSSLEPLVGTVVTVPGVALAELTAGPVDFVWIDLEHGALGGADVAPLAIAARAAGAASLARLPSAGAPAPGALLDAGVDGVVAPHVETAADAARLVEQLRYPPRGSRGFAVRRAHGYDLGVAAAVEDVVCMVQIESPGAVAQAADIAAVDGVDALVVGCADLALALDGHPEPRSPAMRSAVARVQDAADGAGIASGIAGPGDPRLLAELGGGRSTVFVVSADVRVYANALDAGVAAMRLAAEPKVHEREGPHVRS